jgi:hypothetical protein
MNKILKSLLIPIALVAVLIGGVIYLWQHTWQPQITSVVSTTLDALKEQNRLLAFTNQSTATVTTQSQNAIGLSAKKTLIVKGMVRYEVDMAKLKPGDIRWDAQGKMLMVRIPPIEIAPPQIDLSSMQEYAEGRILRTFTNVDDVLDKSNYAKAQAKLVEDAKSPVLMELAQASAKKAIAQNFQISLRAAKVDARVSPFFDGERDTKVTTRWDYSTPLEDIMKK